MLSFPLAVFTNVLEEEFSEVHGSKRPIRRSAKHSTTAWRHPFGVKMFLLGTIRCTVVYQGVATRNDATTREILAHRTGTQPNFALTEFSEVRSGRNLRKLQEVVGSRASLRPKNSRTGSSRPTSESMMNTTWWM